MLTVGMDLAASPTSSGLVVVEWGSERARVTVCVRGVEDVRVLEGFGEADWVGVNAPFGWPVGMVAALAAYGRDEGWPLLTRRDFRYRRTDVFLSDLLQRCCGRKFWPMSVAAERTAMRAFRLATLRERRAETSGSRFARDGSDGVIEVSPQAALMLWNLESEGFRSAGRDRRREACERLLAAMQTQMLYLDLADAEREVLASDENLLDALVAALVARAAALGMTAPPPDEEVAAARAEGWIHVPEPGSLPGLLHAAPAAVAKRRGQAAELAASRWGLDRVAASVS